MMSIVRIRKTPLQSGWMAALPGAVAKSQFANMIPTDRQQCIRPETRKYTTFGRILKGFGLQISGNSEERAMSILQRQEQSSVIPDKLVQRKIISAVLLAHKATKREPNHSIMVACLNQVFESQMWHEVQIV